MTTADISMEHTPVDEKWAGALNIRPAMSLLIAEGKAPGDPFSYFFEPTTTNEAPVASTWLFDKEAGDLWNTTILDQTGSPRGTRWYGVSRAQENQPLERANRDRVTLLARKYVDKEKFSDEERARLAILTERVRQLLPAVTADEYAALESNLKRLNEISNVNQRLRAILENKPQKE